jgi:aspartokinase
MIVMKFGGSSLESAAAINVLMISQGASRLNLGLVVASSDLGGTAAALHNEFFADRDPAVFD